MNEVIAVVLSAGRGKRMNHLTNGVPKPLLKVAGKNILEHKFDALPDDVSGIVLVIGYLGEQIREYFGNEYKGRKIEYVNQGELLGTGAALHEAKNLLTERFMVMMGDYIYLKEDLEECLKHNWVVLAHKTDTPVKGAKVIVDNKNRIVDIIEESEIKKGEYNNVGLYVLGTEIFKYPLVRIGNGEFGLPQSIALAAKDFDVSVVFAHGIFRLTSPEDIGRIENLLAKEEVKLPT